MERYFKKPVLGNERDALLSIKELAQAYHDSLTADQRKGILHGVAGRASKGRYFKEAADFLMQIASEQEPIIESSLDCRELAKSLFLQRVLPGVSNHDIEMRTAVIEFLGFESCMRNHEQTESVMRRLKSECGLVICDDDHRLGRHLVDRAVVNVGAFNLIVNLRTVRNHPDAIW